MKKIDIRFIGIFVCVLLVAMMAAGCVEASEKWVPQKSITIVLPTDPGDYYDSQCRLIADSLSKQLGQTVQINYMPGAGHAIATKFVYDAPADGYTIGHFNLQPFVLNALAFGGDWDPLKFEFLPTFFDMSQDPEYMYLPTTASGKYKNWDDILTSTTPVRWGSVGRGSLVHVVGVVLADAYGFPVWHVLGYSGGGDVVAALARGENDLTCFANSVIEPYVKGNDIVPIFSLGSGQSTRYPGIPSLADKHPELVPLLGAKHFMVLPPGTPKNVVDTLEEAIWVAVNSDEFKELHKKTIAEGKQYGPARAAQSRATIESFVKIFEPLVPLLQND